MKWFKEKEFACRCCGQLPPEARENVRALVENVLDPVRERFGQAICVNSGFRCEKHNREVGGVKGSQHLRGEAADIRPAGLPVTADGLRELARIIVENGRFDQFIIYPSFVHVSWKKNGGNRRQILKKITGSSTYKTVTRKEVLGV